eukprot:Skav216765  [mRNA]  locus=scaffold3378:6891:7659:+ [translate_table: standard]
MARKLRRRLVAQHASASATLQLRARGKTFKSPSKLNSRTNVSHALNRRHVAAPCCEPCQKNHPDSEIRNQKAPAIPLQFGSRSRSQAVALRDTQTVLPRLCKGWE